MQRVPLDPQDRLDCPHFPVKPGVEQEDVSHLVRDLYDLDRAHDFGPLCRMPGPAISLDDESPEVRVGPFPLPPGELPLEGVLLRLTRLCFRYLLRLLEP